MKTYLYLLALASMFLLSACETKPVSEFQSDFTKELTDLSNMNFGLFTATRNGFAELNTEVFEEMIDYAINLSAQYNLAERVQKSGYYSNIDESLAEMDIYEILRYFETNSTPEFYDLISKIIVDAEVIENDEIVHSQNLLPNEQIALIMANNIFANSLLGGFRLNTARCQNFYNSLMKSCNRIFYASSALTVVCGIASFGVLAVALGAATAIDYARCQGEAMDVYMDCIGK